MLQIYVLQHLFNDPVVEKALYGVPLYCRFAGSDLVVDTVADETTLCKLRHLLERDQRAERLFAEVNGELEKRGLVLMRGNGGGRDADGGADLPVS